MDKILVIGGNGFVGGQLCKMGEEKGFKVAVADIADQCTTATYEYHKCDINDYEATLSIFEKSKPSLVVKLVSSFVWALSILTPLLVAIQRFPSLSSHKA